MTAPTTKEQIGRIDGIDPSFPGSAEYFIERTPDIVSVSPGGVLLYTCRPISGRYPTVLSATRTYRDTVRWFKFKEESLLPSAGGKFGVPIVRGPFGFSWRCSWNDDPGRYLVAACVMDGAKRTWCLTRQSVDSAASILRGDLSEERQRLTVSADESERLVVKHLEILRSMEKRFPLAGRAKDRHDQTVQQWTAYAAKLRETLSATDGLARIPVRSVHLTTETQDRRPLNLFLSKLGSKNGRERWVLVDWTLPTHRQFTGSYEGEGTSQAEALEAVLEGWKRGNRYPAGSVMVDLPALLWGVGAQRTFETDGKSFGDHIREALEWVALGGMVVAGVVTLVAPVPGSQIVSAAIWSSMLSSTAAATINIAQRHSDGFSSWREDAFDGLSIIGNMFGAGGVVWARGATVILAKNASKARYVFVGGQLATDAVQGVLIAESHFERYIQLMEDPGLLPEERSFQLLELFRSLSMAGLMTYVSLRANKTDLDHLGKQNRHLSGKGSNPTPSGLEELATVGREIDTTEARVVEGHTKEPVQRTRVETTVRHQLPPAKATETKMAKEYKAGGQWVAREFDDDYILLMDAENFVFEAKCKKGVLSVTIRTEATLEAGEVVRAKNLWAKKLFPAMYDHFRQVGNPVTRLEGMWAWKNYDVAMEAYHALLKAGVPEDKAIKEAVFAALTYKYHKAEGFTVVLKASNHPARNPQPGSAGVLKFIIVRPE